MPTTAPGQRAGRHRRPYSGLFRGLGPDERHTELAHLKKLYDEDRLSIRQIAAPKRSSYAFMQGRLAEAGVNIGSNRAPEPTESVAGGSETGDVVTVRRGSRGARP